ncbi:MAG: hypothetical protein PHG97_01060 [Candidatus Margulisbacteria bacterium]|nr:hypothetical protein [Candidatus Margulisiibacteriota bacterium]
MALEVTARGITTARGMYNPIKKIGGLWAGSKGLAGKTLYLCAGSCQFVSMPEGNKITPMTARVTFLGFGINMLSNVSYEAGTIVDSPAIKELAGALDSALPKPTKLTIWKIKFSQDAGAVRDFFRIVCRSIVVFANKSVIAGCEVEFVPEERLAPPAKMIVFAD